MSSTGNFVQSEFRYEEGKSPLTLLAETCRNIGVDTTTIKLTKSVIDHTKSSSSAASVESRKSNDSCRLSVSPIRNGSSNSDKQSTPITQTNRPNVNSLTGSNNNSSNSSSSSSNNNSSNGSSNNNNNSNSNNSTSIISVNGVREQSNKCSFKPYEDHVTNKRPCTEESKRSSGTPTSRSPSNSDKNNNNSNSNNSSSSNNSANRRISSESPRSNKGRESVTRSSPATGNSNSHLPSASVASSSSSAITTQINSKTTLLTTANCYPTYSVASTPHQHTQLAIDSVSKFVPYPSISPYLGLPGSYEAALAAATAARLGAPGQNGAQSHCHSPSMCRNPFCPGCRFAAAAAAAANNLSGSVPGSCPAGCTQCSHTSSIASSMGLAAALQNSYLSAANNQGAHAFYQQQAAAAAASVGLGKPNICSWMVGNTFCGKRFASSEELVQHLRNHTSSDPSSLSALAFLGQYPHLNPMLASPGLRQTSFGPSQSALAAATAAAAAANRYHPYKSFSGNSPLTNLPSGLSSLPTLTSPGSASSPLNMHYPSYGPYPGRMGPPIPP